MSAKLINEKKNRNNIHWVHHFFLSLREYLRVISGLRQTKREEEKEKKHSQLFMFIQKKTGTQKWPDINLWYTRVRLNSFDWNERTQYYIYIYNQRQQHLNWFNSQIESFWDCRLIEDCGDFSAYTVCNATQSGKCMVRV